MLTPEEQIIIERDKIRELYKTRLAAEAIQFWVRAIFLFGMAYTAGSVLGSMLS